MSAILTAQLDGTEDAWAAALLDRYGDGGSYRYAASQVTGTIHVATSYLDVVRKGWKRMTPRTRGAEMRHERRQYLLALIASHKRNRDLVRHFQF